LSTRSIGWSAQVPQAFGEREVTDGARAMIGAEVGHAERSPAPVGDVRVSAVNLALSAFPNAQNSFTFRGGEVIGIAAEGKGGDGRIQVMMFGIEEMQAGIG